MKNLITSSNLTFTKKNCNCGITSNTLDKQTKSRKKSHKKKTKNHKKKTKNHKKNSHKTKNNKYNKHKIVKIHT